MADEVPSAIICFNPVISGIFLHWGRLGKHITMQGL